MKNSHWTGKLGFWPFASGRETRLKRCPSFPRKSPFLVVLSCPEFSPEPHPTRVASCKHRIKAISRVKLRSLLRTVFPWPKFPRATSVRLAATRRRSGWDVAPNAPHFRLFPKKKSRPQPKNRVLKTPAARARWEAPNHSRFLPLKRKTHRVYRRE